MQRASVDDLDGAGLGPGSERVALADALGTTGMAINRYRIPPGEG